MHLATKNNKNLLVYVPGGQNAEVGILKTPKINVSPGCIPFGGFGKNSIPCFLQSLKTTCCS